MVHSFIPQTRIRRGICKPLHLVSRVVYGQKYTTGQQEQRELFPQAILYLALWKLENCEPTFDEDCAGMRILCILNESVLLFSKNMLTHYTSIAQNIRGQALNRIHSLASTCKNKTLHVPSLGPSQSNYLPSTRETKNSEGVISKLLS
jgi:hypothetical protein